MNDTPITIGLPKGRNFEDTINLLKKAGYDLPEINKKGRQLVYYSNCKKLKFVILRDTDIPVYVEHGAVEIGVSGKDMLMESGKDLYEPLDLGFGGCRICVAGPKGSEVAYKNSSAITVATKFVKITENFFREKGVNAEVIKLNGTQELAPLVGLSEYIVDLVSTGTTLKENGLIELEDVDTISARLAVNRAALKLRHSEIIPLIEELKKALDN